MSILKNKLKSQFSQLPNELITDTRLSHGAFRVAAYLFSRPDGWNVFNKDIQVQLGIKQSQTLADYWNELLDTGWIKRERKRENGKIIGGFDYELSLIMENPQCEKSLNRENATNTKNHTLINTDKESNTEFLKKKEERNTNNSPNGGFSENDLSDFEEQASKSKEAPLDESAIEKEKKLRQKKKNETKWNGSFQDAKDCFDKYRKTWMKKRHGVDGDPIYWNGMETGQLSNLLTALKSKSSDAGHIYDSDKEFIESVLPVFLEYATRLDKYYMNEFTPTRFYSNFNTIYADIKILFTNGTSTTNGKRHGISQDFKNAIASQLD